MTRLTNMERIDSGSNYAFPEKMEYARMNTSLFNMSHTVTTTINNGGVIVPLTWWQYMLGDSFDISVRHLIRVMPQVVPLMSKQRIFIHAFAMNFADMQSDFQVFMTKGMRGTKIKKLAPLTTSNIDPTIYDSGTGKVEPESLADYLGLPIGATYADLISAGIIAHPFFMYEMIWNKEYMNRNYHMDNENYIPDDPESMRMNELGQIASNTDSDHDYIYLGKLRYRDYPDDYLLSCLPFAQRGNRPTLDISFEGDLFNFINPLAVNYHAAGPVSSNRVLSPDLHQTTNPFPLATGNDLLGPASYTKEGFLGTIENTPFGTSADINSREKAIPAIAAAQSKIFNDAIKGNISTTIGLDDIRQLVREQRELEMMAKTDGSYREFGLSFFHIAPSTSRECEPILIGSTYSQLSFTEVVQSGATSADGVLGTLAGHGISIDNKGYLGHFEAKDFGIIMIVAVIMPDVFYCQNIDKKWNVKYQSEMYLPTRAKMGMQPVLNKEAYFTGTKATDEDLFGYQNPFDELRYMPNRVSGKVADPDNASFSPYTQVRFLNSTPTLTQSFAEADDVSKEYLFSKEESAYIGQFNFDIRAVRPIPYTAIPMDFGL